MEVCNRYKKISINYNYKTNLKRVSERTCTYAWDVLSDKETLAEATQISLLKAIVKVFNVGTEGKQKR